MRFLLAGGDFLHHLPLTACRGEKDLESTKNACGSCHDASYTVEKYMPNTGKTADNLFVRSHTFSKMPRQGGPGAESMGEPNYYGD